VLERLQKLAGRAAVTPACQRYTSR
jgi:hypothetical protein